MPDVATCWLCGRPSEPPFTIATSRFPDEVVEAPGPDGPLAETEHVICGECVEGIQEDREGTAGLAAEDAAGLGTRCGLCRADLNPPGGYAIKSGGGAGRVRVRRFQLAGGDAENVPRLPAVPRQGR